MASRLNLLRSRRTNDAAEKLARAGWRVHGGVRTAADADSLREQGIEPVELDEGVVVAVHGEGACVPRSAVGVHAHTASGLRLHPDAGGGLVDGDCGPG